MAQLGARRGHEAMGMSHTGPLGVVAPLVPGAGTAQAQGDAGGSSPGERLQVQSQSPPDSGNWWGDDWEEPG